MKQFNITVDKINISNVMALATLQLNREVSRAEIAEALGVERQTAIKNKNRALTSEEIEKIERGLNISFSSESSTYIDNPSKFPGKKEIKYWGEGLPCEEKLRKPGINSVMYSREIINIDWQVDENSINIIAMPGDKMDGGIVIGEVVGHGLDLVFNSFEICALLCDDEALAGMLFTGGKLGIRAASHSLESRLHGNGVLLGIHYPFDTANGIRMSLADALAPEGVILALGQDGGGIQAVEGEQTGIPAHGDHGNVISVPRGGIHRSIMGRNLSMIVKAIDHVEFPGKRRRHDRQIGSAAAADDQHIQFILPIGHIIHRHDRNLRSPERYGGRISPCKNSA